MRNTQHVVMPPIHTTVRVVPMSTTQTFQQAWLRYVEDCYREREATAQLRLTRFKVHCTTCDVSRLVMSAVVALRFVENHRGHATSVKSTTSTIYKEKTS